MLMHFTLYYYGLYCVLSLEEMGVLNVERKLLKKCNERKRE